LPKYSTDNGGGTAVDPASVYVAGRFTPRFIIVVGSPAAWLVLITIGITDCP